ncbi:MAG TPA: hypothetical protein VMS56_14725 [Thermoanaerobaculia bacterium]|nr:hypothetical protein [Thermoanaerobaculia bacterium]
MPKSLFYLGVIFSMLAALLLAGVVIDRGLTGEWLEVSSVQLLRGSTTTGVIAVMLLSIPVAGFFLRMAALVAPRNLFAALFAIFATGSAAVSAGLYAALDFRAALLDRQARLTAAQADTLDMLLELRVATVWALGFFLATMFLSTRPYFRIQGRVLAAVVSWPLPVFFLIFATQFLPTPPGALTAIAAAFLLLLFAFLFAAVSVHGLRHRHLFIEVTNLRELLDGRIDPEPPGGGPRRRFSFGSRVPLTE